MITNSDPAHIALAQRIFDRQFAEDPELNREMDDRRKQLMFQDILYNFSFLSTAVKLEDEKIFSSYVLWLYELLCNLMKDLDRDRIKDQMISHYTILKNSTAEFVLRRSAGLCRSNDRSCHTGYRTGGGQLSNIRCLPLR